MSDEKDEKDEKLENEAETPEHEGAEEAKPEGKEEKPAKKRRRGSAETTTTAKRETVAAPRDSEGRVSVRAQAKYVRCALRGRPGWWSTTSAGSPSTRRVPSWPPRRAAAARDVLKLLDVRRSPTRSTTTSWSATS